MWDIDNKSILYVKPQYILIAKQINHLLSQNYDNIHGKKKHTTESSLEHRTNYWNNPWLSFAEHRTNVGLI
jgi:hypothetical protein